MQRRLLSSHSYASLTRRRLIPTLLYRVVACVVSSRALVVALSSSGVSVAVRVSMSDCERRGERGSVASYDRFVTTSG